MGRLVILEGVDGCGKTTTARLLEESLAREGAKAIVFRDPGTTKLGEDIRNLVLHRKDIRLSLNAETLLFMAAREQMLEELIWPSLPRYDFVILDRFSLSTIAYQGAQFQARSGDAGFKKLYYLVQLVHGHVDYDLLVYLDLSFAAAQERNHTPDKMSGRGSEFMQSVWNCYSTGYKLLSNGDTERHLLVDASQPPETVVRLILKKLGFHQLLSEIPILGSN